jgi:two-component system phosphate regulon response regulator PhoB
VKQKVMVVDDDPLILNVVATILDLEEFEVVTYRSAHEALAAMGDDVPAAVVTDVMMPDMDGLELARRVRSDERFADVPIVMLTAADTGQDRHEGRQAGGDAYLTKPFSPLELIDVLEGLLAARQPR